MHVLFFIFPFFKYFCGNVQINQSNSQLCDKGCNIAEGVKNRRNQIKKTRFKMKTKLAKLAAYKLSIILFFIFPYNLYYCGNVQINQSNSQLCDKGHNIAEGVKNRGNQIIKTCFKMKAKLAKWQHINCPSYFFPCFLIIFILLRKCSN